MSFREITWTHFERCFRESGHLGSNITLKKTTIKLHNTLDLPVLLYGSEIWTVKASDGRRITAAEMKYMRRTAGYTWGADYRTNAQIAKD